MKNRTPLILLSLLVSMPTGYLCAAAESNQKLFPLTEKNNKEKSITPQSNLLLAIILKNTPLTKNIAELIEHYQKPYLKEQTITFDKEINLSTAITPDDKIIATAVRQNICLYNAATEQHLNTLEGHTDVVTSIAFSPDGTLIASGSWDKTIKIWNTQTGQCLLTLKGHTYSVHSVAFSPDGQQIVSGSHDATVRIWNISTGNCINILEKHTSIVSTAAFSPDNQFIASGSHDYMVCIWDTNTGSHLHTLKKHTHKVNSVAFSPDNNSIISGGDDHKIHIWNTKTGEYITTLKGHTALVNSVVFSPNGRYIASGSWDKVICIWDVTTNNLVAQLKNHIYEITSVTFSSDSAYIISGTLQGEVCISDVETAIIAQKESTMTLSDENNKEAEQAAHELEQAPQHIDPALLLDAEKWAKTQYAPLNSPLLFENPPLLSDTGFFPKRKKFN